MDFRNLEMKNLSPYSGRFAGRLIKSGKVTANFKYILQDYKMTGDNKIIIDKLTLGDKVEAPESANLPLDLAIALLQDANGRIDVGLPVSGDLSDPEFSFGGLIWKVFTNLITKAATSPFRAIGGLLGAGEDNFDAVAFDHGKADLLPPEKEKLLKLTEALNSRPQLKLVVQGRYSIESDGNELKQRAVRAQVARKRGIKPDPNELSQPLDFDNSDTREALEQLYVERFGKKALEELEQGVAAGTVTPRLPVDPQTIQKKEAGFLSRMTDSLNLYKLIPGGMSREQTALWSGELFVRLTESEKIADTALLQLADNRAQAVAGHLRNEARIGSDRLEIKTAEPLPEGDPPSATLSLEAL
jgi:outer membrane protein OmpA-like peptidoglycan-associated protein